MARPVGRRRPDLSTEEIVRRYEAGESSWNIASAVQCAQRTVLKRLRSAGVEPRAAGTNPKRRGPASPCWRGGRTRLRNGYWVVNVDGELLLEHRHVLQQALGRKLLDSEIVHHFNHDKGDNRLENLFILTKEQHKRLHDQERWYCAGGHRRVADDAKLAIPFLTWWLERHVFTCPKLRRRTGASNAA
jgi:5-methylcytosine-specific restriction endonuclease McrA